MIACSWGVHSLRRLLAVAVLVTGSAAAAMAAYHRPRSTSTPPRSIRPATAMPTTSSRRCRPPPRPGYARLGHVASAFTGAAFTRAATLKRTPADWGYYVHSHGDYYSTRRRPALHRLPRGLRRLQPGRRVLEGHQGQAARTPEQPGLRLDLPRRRRQHDPARRLRDREDEELRRRQPGPGVLRRLLGVQWDADEWIFEQRFWNALAGGKSVGAAFDVAMLGAFGHAGVRRRLVGHLPLVRVSPDRGRPVRTAARREPLHAFSFASTSTAWRGPRHRPPSRGRRCRWTGRRSQPVRGRRTIGPGGRHRFGPARPCRSSCPSRHGRARDPRHDPSSAGGLRTRSSTTPMTKSARWTRRGARLP